MKKEDGYFRTGDGLKLYYAWYAADRPKHVLMLLHGHGEHIGRYEKFAPFFNELGISFAAYDTRGSGRSEGLPVYVDSLEDLISDISTFRKFLEERYGVRGKFFLFGHSLGGLSAFHWALANKGEIDALFLSSPCLGLKLPLPLAVLNNFLNCIVPKMLYANPVYPPYLTHNPEEVETYKKDPLIRRKISVRLLSEMIRYTAKLDGQEAYEFPFPVYILMAGLEKVVDKDKTLRIYERIKAPRKHLKCFDGFYHEIFNELGQEKVFQEFRDCLLDAARRLSPSA